MKRMVSVLLLFAMLLGLCGCGPQSAAPGSEPTESPTPSPAVSGAVLTSPAPLPTQEGERPKAVEPIVLLPVADGRTVYSGEIDGASALVDASNAHLGYLMVSGRSKSVLKVSIFSPDGVRYNYDLPNDGTYATYPLCEGNGNYEIGVYMHLQGNEYMYVLVKSIPVQMDDPFSPFLRPSQYVDYDENSLLIQKVKSLCNEDMSELEKIEAVYRYVIGYSYDHDKANTVQAGYLPDVDEVISQNKGICFDYAVVMTAMLRTLGIPTKLVIGHTRREYHAWVSVYTRESGTVDGRLLFDGSGWKLLDPTFDSTGSSSAEITAHIENPQNYEPKTYY